MDIVTINDAVKADQFFNLFVKNTPFLDVRSEGEFTKGSIPNSFNYPILNNSERHQIGTCYKRKGKQMAVELGYQLVSGVVKQKRIQDWCDLASLEPNLHVLCWRGGLRSGIAQQWIREAGFQLPVIEGGYKALRRYLLQAIAQAANHFSFIRIGGKTGVAKTLLINEIKSSIDLEKHAKHRGSSFGRTINLQPTQSNFEHSLAADLLRIMHMENSKILFVEDESRNIGATAVPEIFFQTMRRSPLVLIEMPLEFRVQRILQEYIMNMLAAFRAEYHDQGFDLFGCYIQNSLSGIQKRLGLERYKRVQKLQINALKQQIITGSVCDHAAWITVLLTEYYDPMYEYQISKNSVPVIFRGNYDEVSEWAASYTI